MFEALIMEESKKGVRNHFQTPNVIVLQKNSLLKHLLYLLVPPGASPSKDKGALIPVAQSITVTEPGQLI